MSKQPPKPSTAPSPARPTPGTEVRADPADHGRHGQHDDDYLHVPKGVSRGTFIFLVGLLIFLLVIWMGGDSLFGIAGGGSNRNPVAVRFRTPGGREVAWNYFDVQSAQRTLQDGISFDRAGLAYMLGLNASKPEPSALTRILVLDEIAREAGVEVTDAALANHIRESLSFGRPPEEQGNIAADFKALVRASNRDQRTVEETLRKLLRVSRFVNMVSFAGAMPDPAKIEEQWKSENVEFAFDYAVLPVETLTEEARQSLPDDAGLQAWFDALSEDEKEELKTPEKRQAELVLFRDSETTPAAELLKDFPEKLPEGESPTEPVELANRYYDEVFPRRFARPREEGQDPDAPTGFFDFEEVMEACVAEAPVYYAMQRWIEDLNSRHANGEPIDFAAEAQKYGLEHQPYPAAMTREELSAAPDAGTDVARAAFLVPSDGSFHDLPVALPHGVGVVRVTARTAPELPPFESIRERVVEKWLEPKARELALERLKKLREGFETFEPPLEEGETPPDPKSATKHYRVDSEGFRAAASAQGLEVATRDYLNKSTPARKDALPEDEDHRALFSLASSWGLYRLAADEVAEPGTSADQKRVYLVRLAGTRDVPIESMSPTQYDRYKRSARQAAVAEIGQELDLDFLRANCGLWLIEDDAQSQAEDEGDKPAAQDG